MGDPYLADLVRCVGVVVALVASFLAAPAATREMWQRATTRGQAGWRLVRTHAVQLWVRLTRRSRSANVAVLPAVVTITASGNLTVTGSASGSAPADNLETRVTRLETRVVELQRASDDNRQAITTETQERQEADERLSQRMTEEVTAIRDGIQASEEESRRVDASVLPVLGLGVVLSGIPDLLATWVGLAVASVILGLAAMQRALVHFWQSGPAGDPSEG